MALFPSVYLFACGHAAGERDFGDHRVMAEQGAGLGSTLHHTEEPIRYPGLFVDLSQYDGGHRSHRRGLKHHRIT